AIRPPRAGDAGAATDLDGFFGRAAPRADAPAAALAVARSGRRAGVRLARHDALALRRAGLHGVGHAGREVDARRLAGARGDDAARGPLALPRRRAGPHPAPGPARRRGSDLPDVARALRRARGGGGDSGPQGPRVALRAGRAGPAARDRPRDVRGRAHAQERERLAAFAGEQRRISTLAALRV